MRRFSVLLILIALVAAGQQLKERPADSPQLQNETAGQPGTIEVPAGTQIPLRLAQAISTKNAKPGDDRADLQKHAEGRAFPERCKAEHIGSRNQRKRRGI